VTIPVGSGAAPETTTDLLLGGRFAVVQPARGHHRAGTDALLLAAAVATDARGLVVDLGAGCGTAGLAVAARCPAATVALVEREPLLAHLARVALTVPENAGIADRVAVVEADIGAPEVERVAAGLVRGGATHVILNPPFHASGAVRASPAAGRAAAHVLAPDGLERWLRTAAWALEPGGVVAVIFPADGLDRLLAALEGRFGAVAIRPVHPRAGAPAIRVVVRAGLGSRGPMRLCDRLVLHAGTRSAWTAEAEAVFRDAAPLAFA
jgi:tRNA1(Val) A37 N6-methylase TrmN6